MNEFLPDDAICREDPTCMECGRECTKTEYVWTGDMNSYKGWELWCYCEHCNVETFHKCVSAFAELKQVKK